MGGVVSSGRNNDELVDNLMESGYIRTKRVEQVFRAVDRVNYVLCTHRENAYKDLAWKHGNIHLSAPCIYSEVMEGLSLEPGLSFLNLGSGTGYLSTMAGLILNQHGTNHGIELHEDCLKYAYDRLDEFKLNSLALDEFDFCEPVFVQGNCLSVVPARQYDRVYCGAACPETHEAYIKQYVRVGGILVMPFKDHLLRIQRVDDNTWTHHTMLPVSFAPLIVPKTVENNLYHLPECDPLSLQELCRGKIRHRLRQNVWCEHADLETKKPILPGRQILSPQQNALRRLVIPIFEESDEDEDFAGRARLLLNVDAHEEALSTALQLVGRVIQPNQNEDRQNWQETTNNGNNDNNRFIVASVDLHRDGDDEDRDNNGKEEPVDPDTDDTANDDDDVADSSTNGNREENDRELEQRRNATEAYSNASDSDTDPEQETAFAQRKKIAKREKTDSGIVEDANFTNDEASSSSNTNQSDSEMADTTDNTDAMDVDLYDVTPNKSLKNAYNSYSTSANSTSNQEVAIAHYIDENAFSSYMKDKIHQLPLPFALKLYINYNRKL